MSGESKSLRESGSAPWWRNPSYETKRYQIRDIRGGWTEEQLRENERMMCEELNGLFIQGRQSNIDPYPYDESRYRTVAKEDYSVLFAQMAPKIPPSLCGSFFLRKVMKWLVG